MELGVKKVAMSQRLKPRNLTRTFYLDTKRTLDEVPFANEIPFVERENFAEGTFSFGNQKFSVEIPNLTSTQIKAYQKGFKDLEKWLKDPAPENWIETFRTPSKTGQTHQSEFSLNLRKYLQGQPINARAQKIFDTINIRNLLGDKANEIQTYTPQEFRRVSNLPKSKKAAEVALNKSMKAASAVRDVFVENPDADLEDVARGIFGTKKFDNASLIVQEDMLSKASDDTAKFLEAITANRKVKGFKPISADKLGDIIQNIEDNTKDFKFREGTIREYRFRIRDSLLGIKTESAEGFRNLRNVVGGTDKGKVVDEVFGLSATFKNAPGYVENVQLIDKTINNIKGKQIDKPFSAIVNAVKNKKDIVQYEGKETNISEAIKKFNAKSKAFGKKNNISTPQILIGDNLDANKLVSNFKDYSPQAQKNILDLADEGFVLTSTKPATPVGRLVFKPGMQPDGQLKDKPGGNTKGSFGGKELAKATGQKLLQALKILGSPGVSSGYGVYELGQGNIKMAGGSLLLPEIAKGVAPQGAGILSKLGRFALNPYGRYARGLTPVGLATIGIGMGKDVYDEYLRRQALTPTERLAEDLEAQQKFDEVMIGAAEGGRIGFADGPEDPSKRLFLKVMGGIASLPIVGKLFKGGAPIVEKLVNTPTKMPDWFPNFVQKFMNNSFGKKIDADLMEYKNPDLPGVTVTRSDDGRVFVEGRNEYDQPYEIQYEPPGYELIDPKTGQSVKTPGNFEAVEGRHVAVGPEDYDIEAYYPADLDEIAAGDIRAMEKYATGKVSGTVKDAMGKDTGLKKGEYDLNMAEGRAESAADVARDLDD